MDQYTDFLSTLNRHARHLLGVAFGDVPQDHHQQALKTENLLEESSAKEENASLKAKLQEQRASLELEFEKQKASLAAKFREEKESLEADWRAQRAHLEEECHQQKASADAAIDAERKKLYRFVSSVTRQLYGQRKQIDLLRAAQHERMLADLKKQAARWMVAPWDCPASCDDADVPMVFSTWSLREETRRIQEDMPRLYNHLEEYYQQEKMLQHLVKQQRRESELERMAYIKCQIHEGGSKEKKQRKSEEKAKREAEKIEKKKKAKQEKEEAKEAAMAEKAAAGGKRSFKRLLLCCFRRRATAAD
ncbi:glutamic acid-rich protein-like [Engraulis encrasicolus]|uniref:glutamic acid-rich protein-like n=1 Tax=Engraulis encrasicolus TaxID=184585 RepID=UPI002FD3ACF8